jgi:hypothetical protein
MACFKFFQKLVDPVRKLYPKGSPLLTPLQNRTLWNLVGFCNGAKQSFLTGQAPAKAGQNDTVVDCEQIFIYLQSTGETRTSPDGYSYSVGVVDFLYWKIHDHLRDLRTSG